MNPTLEQLNRIAGELIDHLNKKQAEIEASQTALLRSQEEVKKRTEQLIKERQMVLAQVETIKQQKEESQAKLEAANKLQAINKQDRLVIDTESMKLKQREEAVQKLEKSVEGIKERESILADSEKNLKDERLYIAKQKLLLEEKSESQKIIDEQLTAREEHLRRMRS